MMNLDELLKICISEKKIISLTGAGGKTTLMYRLAEKAAKQGRKVMVSTTTHIMRPEENLAADIEGVRALWHKGEYAVIGSIDSASPGKLIFPERELYDRVKKEAELIFLEADGSKGLPCKVPAAHEPVIEESDLVIGVMGMSALGQNMKECCFRFREEGKWLGVDEDAVLNEDIAVRILASENGTRKYAEDREYIVVLNQCDNEEKMKRAQTIAEMLKEKYDIKAVCCCLKMLY